MKMLTLPLVWALFIVACNDSEKGNKRNAIADNPPSYNPPVCEQNYKEIYSQPEGFYGAAFGGDPSSENIFNFPEPKDPEQKKHWEKGGENKYGKVFRGYIKALEDGEVEISGLMRLSFNAEGEIGLLIGNQKDPIKIFNAKNSKLIQDNGGYSDKYYEIHASASVKAGEKILFKQLKYTAAPQRVKICFKHN